ncbi:hypothetical protein V1504DRAFT_436270 [Lipomyces starkeyi]
MGKVSIKVQAQIPTPKEMCDRLMKLYGQSTAGFRTLLKGELANLMYCDFKDVNKFVQQFTGLVSRHAAVMRQRESQSMTNNKFVEVVGSDFEVWRRLKRAEVQRGLTVEDLTNDFWRRHGTNRRRAQLLRRQKEAQDLEREGDKNLL